MTDFSSHCKLSMGSIHAEGYIKLKNVQICKGSNQNDIRSINFSVTFW